MGKQSIVVLRGGGDLASGVALRLNRTGIKVVITELAHPLAVRRLVAFSEAIYQIQITIEGVTARSVERPEELMGVLTKGEIPVVVDPECRLVTYPGFDVVALVDARMRKKHPELGMDAAPIVIGLGPGFTAGENCHAVIETNRGHFLGRVIWDGSPEPDSGIPGRVGSVQSERVLRAPGDGILRSHMELGKWVKSGEPIADVSGKGIVAPFDGILRGLLRDGMMVKMGMKVGDLDPRNEPSYAATISEKSLAIGGGVLEALLTLPEIRRKLWI